MDENRKQKLYRIGPFAHHMGVTTDLLKHYEQFHLVESTASDSGYRYYPFFQSSRLLDSRTLQNYGFSLREISTLLNGAEPDAFCHALRARGEGLERELLFLHAVLEEQRQLSAWMERMATQEWDCREEELEPFCFLPHTHRRDFLPDERVYEILKDWTDWMPVVKSCQEIIPAQKDLQLLDHNEFYWGLILPLSQAEKYSIPLNDMVTHIPRRRWLLCDYMLPRLTTVPERSFLMKPLQEELDRRHLTPAGAIYNIRPLHANAGGSGSTLPRMGCFIVPMG